MRFSDVTLDGLMKEFDKISKANEASETGYVLPQDLLDQPAATADVPYYEEVLKTTAAERSKLYGAVADSKILDEAHPKGSAKLEGLSGDEITVEDLHEMKAQFEKVLNSNVKAKSAGLVKKLLKLARQLKDAGHTKLAQQVVSQLKKLAYDPDFGFEEAEKNDKMDLNEGDLAADLRSRAEVYLKSLYATIRVIDAESGSLGDDQKAQWQIVKEQAPEVATMALQAIINNDTKNATQALRTLQQIFHPYVKTVKDTKALESYRSAFEQLTKVVSGWGGAGEQSKTGPHQGMMAAQKMLNQYLNLKKSKGGNVTLVQENGNQGDTATWDAIKKHLYLTPGKDFKNYEELLAKMREQIKGISPGQSPDTVQVPDALTPENMRKSLQPGAGPDTGQKGPPVIPLSRHKHMPIV